MGSNGVDLSNNNGKVDITTLTGLDFVIAKATEGTGFVDQDYQYYRDQAAAHGVVFGAYHFAHPGNHAARNEAQMFANIAKPTSGVICWIDYELPSGDYTADAQWLTDFYNEFKTFYPFTKLGLYADLTNFQGVLPHTPRTDAYWLALYDNQADAGTDHVMPHGVSWNVHQYTVFQNIDRNYSRWTKDEMAAFGRWPGEEDTGETAVNAGTENQVQVQDVETAVANLEQAAEEPPAGESALTWEYQVTLAIADVQARLAALETHVQGN